MYFDLLCSLYLGKSTNADLSTKDVRRQLHIPTALDAFIPLQLAAKKDVILTGNPGDGKSHLVRLLQDTQKLPADVLVEPDLSASAPQDVIARWMSARSSRRPFLMCANEGPLRELLPLLSATSALNDAARALQTQLGRLCGLPQQLAETPSEQLVLIDLADRSLLAPAMIEKAIHLVTQPDFIPQGNYVESDCAPARNISLLSAWPAIRSNLALILSSAGQRSGGHVTFRSLWATIALAITGGESPAQAVRRWEPESMPLDLVVQGGSQLALADAVRRFADPAAVPMPELDYALWLKGKPAEGGWYFETDRHQPILLPTQTPAYLHRGGATEAALLRFASLKRLVALAHPAGKCLLEALQQQQALPSQQADDALLEVCLQGIRRCFVSAAHERGLPAWMQEGLPLWVNLTYQDVPTQERPHVAVASAPAEAFRIVRPARVPWLQQALGDLPELAWLCHVPSGTHLRLDPPLLAMLRGARASAGPVPTPQALSRFLSRLSSWEERQAAQKLQTAQEDHIAVLGRPRGNVLVTGGVAFDSRGAFYVEP